MARTVLLTLGRLPKALDLARGFKALGWRVLVAEPFRWHLARMSRSVDRSFAVTPPAASKRRYLEDLAAIVAREGVELVVPVSEEIMHAAHLRPLLPAGTRLYAPLPERLLALHDKRRFNGIAAGLGLPVPETHPLGSAGGAALAARHDTIVKPVYSCSGKGVGRHAAGAPLPAPDPTVPAIVQALVRGAEHSTFTLAHEGRVLATAIYRGAVMSGSVAVCFERVEVPAIVSWTEAFVAGTGHSGFIAFDFVVDAGGEAQAIECNPRVTSGIHFLDGADVARAIVDPDAAPPICARDETLMQQFWPCLTETQKSAFDRARFRTNLRHLLRARDVTWSARDPLPLLTMPATAARIIGMSIRRGATFGEVATLDIDWYEGDT